MHNSKCRIKVRSVHSMADSINMTVTSRGCAIQAGLVVDKKSLFVSETTFVIKWLLPIEFSIMCLLQEVNSSIFGR